MLDGILAPWLSKSKEDKHSELVSHILPLLCTMPVTQNVPVADIQRLLKEKPAITGLAVPGMPASSPGMDVPNNTDPYQVIAFSKGGSKSVYSEYHFPDK